MGGICGIVDLSGAPLRVEDLEPMRRKLAHRGPHGISNWNDDCAALGHFALRTTSQSQYDSLPWRHAASGQVITADARIDNRDELLESLELERGDEIGDGELILRSYLAWGADCVGRLAGDFAFAIWNPTERRLFCARDHLGMRPLYIAREVDGLVFASSARGVAAGMRRPPGLNVGRLADYLVPRGEGRGAGETFFEGVQSLPAANCAWLRRGAFSCRNYWETDRLAVDAGAKDASCDALFDASFRQAVRRCLRSDEPVAAQLSGGIDSSAIVGTAASLRSEGMVEPPGTLERTVSQVSEFESGHAENRCIQAVVDYCGIASVQLGKEALSERAPLIDAWLGDLEDPFDHVMLQRFVLNCVAAEYGHRVLLDGVDGDLVASLPPWYPKYYATQGRWVEGLRESTGQWARCYNRGTSLAQSLLAMVWQGLAPSELRRARRARQSRREVKKIGKDCFIHPDFAQKVDLKNRYFGEEPTCPGMGLESARVNGLSSARAAMSRSPFLVAAAERYERVAASCGLESRHPLLDRQFIETCLRLPASYMCRDGWEKYGLRRLAARVVPEQVAWRREPGGLEGQWNRAWLFQNRDEMMATLDSGWLRYSGIVDWDNFVSELKSYMMQRSESTAAMTMFLYRFYALERWINSVNL